MNIIDNAELRHRLREYGGPLAPDEVIVLHVWEPTDAERRGQGVPACFRRARRWGHLFGRTADYLHCVAVGLGVMHPLVHRAGEKCQHIDLCGKPLRDLVKTHLVPAHDRFRADPPDVEADRISDGGGEA